MALPASLKSRCSKAVAAAAAYVSGRQSPSGGFCFYRYGPLEEPSLADTYYAVSALKLCDRDVPHALQVADFVSQERLWGLTYLYFHAFTLERLGLAGRVSAGAIAQIDALTITLPDRSRAASSQDRSGWLESVRKTIRLQQRFGAGAHSTQTQSVAQTEPAVPADPVPVLLQRDRHAPVARYIRDVIAGGELGVRVNLWDTYRALAIAVLLGIRAMAATVSFVDALQQPPFGFLMAPRAAMASLEVLHAGTCCCTFLGLPIRHAREVIEFVLACQGADGGFALAPSSLPNLERTYHALQILAVLAPEAAHSD